MEKNKKILFIQNIVLYKDNQNNYYTNGNYNMEVWERYLKHSNDFTVLAKISHIDEAKSSQYNFFDDKRIKIIEMKSNKKNKFINFVSIKNRKVTKRSIKTAVLKSDVLILRMPSKQSYLAFDYGVKYNKKIIIEVVGSGFYSLWHHSFIGKILAFQNYFKMKKRIQKAQNVIYVTEQYLQKEYPTKGNYISCSDVMIDFCQNNNPISNEKLFNKEKIIFGIIGKVDLKYKGHKTAIKALSILKEKYNIDFRLQLVGSGNPQKIIKMSKKLNIDQNIEFLGLLKHEDVLEWLKNIDFYVQPSLTEGLPRSVIEAMASGCIVIGSNAGGIPELISEDLIFSKGNYRDLVNIILKLINNISLIQTNLVKNYQKLMSFSKEYLDDKRYAFINKIIND